jgi:mannosyltransferase OCH1-like enzyme
VIPKLIHQIYLTGELPDRLKRHVDSLKLRQPGWVHRLYNNEDAEQFITTHYGLEMLATYRLINPEYGAARADLFRQLIIYKLGGVYLDILTQWRNGPGELNEGFGLHPELKHIPGGEYTNHHLIGVPEHPFTKAAIERITYNIRHYRPWSGVGKMGVVRTTGPVAYTLALHPERANAPHRLTTEEDLGIVFSIRDYEHQQVFTRHYSTLTSPVVRLSRLSRLAQRGVEMVRSLKHRLRDGAKGRRAGP